MLYESHQKTVYGGEPDTTNNRMELQAAISGLKLLKEPCEVALYTDSNYLKQGMTEWLSRWKLKNWKTAANKPVKNVDLWQQLDESVQKHKVTWHWVKAHAGNLYNEKADELARQGVIEQ
jgi:ribonuclease HI